MDEKTDENNNNNNDNESNNRNNNDSIGRNVNDSYSDKKYDAQLQFAQAQMLRCYNDEYHVRWDEMNMSL